MVQLIASNQLTLTNLNEKAIDRTEISFWHGLSATKYPLGVYDCGNRDHQYGNEFNVTSGKTYTVRVIAKQTKGSLGLRGGIWYTAMTSGNTWDGLANFTLVGEVSEDGLGVYERKFAVESGKTKARLFIQIEQWLDSSDRTTWRIYDGQVFDENGQPLVTDQNSYGTLASPMATPNGTYIWKRTITYYTDGTSNTIWEYSGVGKNGIAGKDGVGVKSTVITYANSTSGTTAPSTGWTSAVPTVPAGSYLWTKTVWGYTDNTSETGYSVAMMGVKGQPGANAPTITNVQDQIYLSTSNTAQSGGSWGILIPAWSSGKYYWSRVATTFSNGTTTYSTPVLDEALNQATTNQVKVTQLTQDLDGFKTTVSNTYLSKSDASGTYADKVSVASQITQSATAVTSDVQSWTNNKLTAYSTTQQTATSITNAVASKADKTQITQLSDSINLKVSKGDVVSQINLEAGQILFNSNKLVLNANTTEIAGDAFIRGNMIVDKSITAEKIEVDTLASISANIGDIRAGSITGINILSSSITNVYDFDHNGVRHSGLVSLKDGFNVEDFAEISGKTKYGKVNMIGGGYSTGLNIQEYPDVKDINSFKMVWVTADGIYFQDSINNFGGSITAENATYVPWTNLILKSGYTAGDGVQPQYRRIKNLDGSYSVQFRGAVSPTSGNFPTSQVQVASLSGNYIPQTHTFVQGSDNTGRGGRVATLSDGRLMILAPNNSSYMYLNTLTYIN